jgi:predicted nucleic acid-binding Zn ribbon protein
MGSSFERPDFCPNCGAGIPENAHACPECGSCDKTGWSENAQSQRLGLPDENFDYEEFVNREFNTPERRRPPIRKFWWVVAIFLLVAAALSFLASLRF